MSGSRRDDGAEHDSRHDPTANEAAAEIIRQREPEPGVAAFAVGDLVARRYRIEALVGRGGMGRVWRAHDIELDQRIALKTLARRRLRDARHAEALKREVQLARRVAHRNVCRVFDIVRAGEQDGQPVWAVAMEFLDGESLADRVERAGPLATDEAVGLAGQLAAGIAAAHEIGVVHRDLKPENIMLVGGDAPRLVIADFGLADDDPDDEEQDRLAGSPMTIAPEQVEGTAAGPPADVYAFGAVLFHMLTGGWPFLGATPLATALARLDAPAPRASSLRPDLPEALDRLIARCLERDPARRPVDGAALRDELHREQEGVPEFEEAGRPGLRVAGFVVLAALAAFALGDGVAELSRSVPVGAEAFRQPDAASTARPGLAIVGFDSEAAEWDWVAVALADRFAAVLGAAGDLRVVPPQRSRDLAADLGEVAAAPTARVSSLISVQSGVQWNLSGTYGVTAGEGRPEVVLELELRGPRARTTTASFTGFVDDLPTIVLRGGEWVRETLALDGPEPRLLDSSMARFAADPEAVRNHALGKQAMRQQDYAAAREYFEAAAAAEPGHPLVLLGLAEAWQALGQPGPALEAAEGALEGVERLDRARQLEVRGRHAIVTNQWDLAEQTYAALFEFYPDDLEYGLLLAESQDRGARLEEALATIQRLRELPEPAGSDPRIDLTEAFIRYHQGDHVGAVPYATSAERAARALGQRSQVARALQLRAELQEPGMDAGQRLALLDEAAGLFEAIGDSQGLIMVLLLRGDTDFDRGDLAGAIEDQGRAVEEAARIGDKRTLARALTSLAISHDVTGQLAAGVEYKERALANYRERDVQQGAAITLENLGISLFKLGRMAESLQRFEEAGQEFARLGDLIGVAWVPYHQGRIWRQLGEVRLARQEMSRARENSGERPEGGLEPYSDYELAWVDIAEDNLDRALAETRRLLALFEEAELAVDAAETRVMLAEIDVERASFGQAIEMATVARESAVATGSAYVVVGADIQLVHAGLAEGRDDIVQRACDGLTSLVPSIEYKVWELSGRVALARCAAWQGDAGAAMAQLAQVAEEAARLGLVWPYAEAVLNHARLRLAAGERSAAVALVGPLRERAVEGGWRRTLRQIDSLMTVGQ